MKRNALLATLSSAVVFAGCQNASTNTKPEQLVTARVVTVESSNGPGSVAVAGVVRPRIEADLSAQLVAPIASVTKRAGDRIRKGEVLVRLRAPALTAGVAQSTAAVESAQQQQAAAKTQAALAADTLARYAQLRERHSVTPYELDQVKAQSAAAQAQQQGAAAQVAVAQAALAMQRANAADAVLTAPFDGVVARRMADPGAMAAPGVPLLHLQAAAAKDVEFYVPETALPHLRTGLTIPVLLGNQRAIARIREVAPGSDGGSHSFLVEASLPSAVDWNAGTVVQIELPSSGATQGLSIPTAALLQQGGLDCVLVLGADNRASVRYVTTGQTGGNSTRILTGLHAGDRILAMGNLSYAGRTIEVLP